MLRNFRKAIYRGDIENAIRFYQRLLDFGYTAEQFQASIRGQDPLSMLPKLDGSRRKFVESITPQEREQLELAYRYYAKIAASRGREANLFPRKRTGERGIERFRENPRLDMLDQILRQSTELTPAKEKQMAERLQKQSLN